MEVQNASSEISLGFQLSGGEKNTDDRCYKTIIENGYINDVYCHSVRPKRVVTDWSGVARVFTRKADNSNRHRNDEKLHLKERGTAPERTSELSTHTDWPKANGERRMNLRITVERCKSRLLNGELKTNHKNGAETTDCNAEARKYPKGKQEPFSNVHSDIKSESKHGQEVAAKRQYNKCGSLSIEDDFDKAALDAKGGKFNIFQPTAKKHRHAQSGLADTLNSEQHLIYKNCNINGSYTDASLGNETEVESETRQFDKAILTVDSVKLKKDYLDSTYRDVKRNVCLSSKGKNSHDECSDTRLTSKKHAGKNLTEKGLKENGSELTSNVIDINDRPVNGIALKEESSCTTDFKKTNCDRVNELKSNIRPRRNCSLGSIAIRTEVNKETLTQPNLDKRNEPPKCGNDVDSAPDSLCKWVNCNASLKGAVELKTHVKETHVKTMAASDLFFCFWKGCKVYNKPSSSYNWLVKHVNTHVGIRPFQCVIEPCDLSFASHNALVRHVQSHFNEKSKYYKKPNDFSKESSASPAGRSKEDETMSSSESTSSKDLKKRRLKLFMRRTRPITAYEVNDGFDRNSIDYVKKKLMHIENENCSLNGLKSVIKPLGRRTTDKGEVQFLMAFSGDKRQSEWYYKNDVLHEGLCQVPVSRLPAEQQQKLYEEIFGTRKRRRCRKVK